MTAPDLFDQVELRSALRLFHVPGCAFEIRVPEAHGALYNGRPDLRTGTAYGYFDDPILADTVVRRTLDRAEWPGVYLTLNPIPSDYLSRAANRFKLAGKKDSQTADKDIRRRRWLLIDLDPDRPAGISASDAEKEAARLRAEEVRRFLASCGWPDPIVADSGNGYHLLYRIDLPGDDGGLVERILRALDARFTDPADPPVRVKVDRTVFNAARIVKLYGTLARKGDHTDERPHRMSRILEEPDELRVVPEDLLRDLAAEATPQADPKPAPSPGTFDLGAFVARYFPGAVAEPWNGGRRWPLPTCPFDESHRGGSAAILQSAAGVISFKCHHNSCAGTKWADVRARYEPRPPRMAQVRTEAPEPWPEPVQFDAPILLPEFPLEALPAELADFVSEIAATVQIPVEMPASLALAVTAATVARRYVVAVGETHEEPVNLYTVAAMLPGARKTEVFSRLAAPLEEIEEEEAKDAAPRIKKAQARRDVAEARMKELKNQIAKAKGKADPQRQELEDLAASLPEVPAIPQLIVGDETAEHLASTLAEQGGRLALLDADAGLFEILAGRYSNAPNFEVYLKGHAGDTIRVGRTTRERDYVKRPALTVGICVQPEVIRALASTPGFRGRGLLGRFLYTLPEDITGTRRYANRPISADAARTYHRLIRTMFKLPTAGEDRPHRLVLAGKALREWATFADRVEAEQREGDRLASVRDWASKAAGAAARIAGVLHVVRYRDCRPAAPWEVEIDEDSVASAVALLDFYTEHALAAYGLMEADARVGLAKRLLRWIERFRADRKVFRPRGPENELGFTLRDCHRHHRAVGRPEDLLPGLDLLESRGYLRRLPPPDPRPANRPPSTVFLVSPLVSEVPEVPEVPGRPVLRSA